MRRIILSLVLLAVMAAPALGQPLTREEIQKLPGYFDFGDIARFSDGEEEIEIDLTQPLLSFVSGAVEYEDPDLAELLTELHLVKVFVFSYDRREREELDAQMTTLREKLDDETWDNIIQVRGDREQAHVYVRMDVGEEGARDVTLSGLVVLVREKYQAVCVNVVGNFRLEDVSKVGRHFDIPHMNRIGGRDRGGDDR